MLVELPPIQNGFSKTVKSGPGPSTMAFGSNETTMLPPLPRERTSMLPCVVPPPTGGPSTTPGRSCAPKPAQWVGGNETTRVTKRLGTEGASAPASDPAPPSTPSPPDELLEPRPSSPENDASSPPPPAGGLEPGLAPH